MQMSAFARQVIRLPMRLFFPMPVAYAAPGQAAGCGVFPIMTAGSAPHPRGGLVGATVEARGSYEMTGSKAFSPLA